MVKCVKDYEERTKHMKILCFADLHIGQKAYANMDKNTGLNVRELNAIKILNYIVDYAIESNMDAVIFAGDMYRNAMPSPTIVDEVNRAVSFLSESKIHTFILDGNHDVNKMSSHDSYLRQFSTLNVPYVHQTRFYDTVDVNGLQFVMLPTYHTEEEIRQCVNEMPNKPSIVIGHMMMQDAMLNDWTVVENETAIPLDVFKNDNIKAVVLGHLHKHQVLQKDPPIFYCGSADRIDFSEENQEKGFVILDTDTWDIDFVPIPLAQKFKTIRLDCRDENDTKLIEEKVSKNIEKENLKDSIVRVQLQLDENTSINENELSKLAYGNGAQYTLKVQKMFNQKKREVETPINNSMSIFSSVETYFANTKRSDERIRIAKTIIGEVDNVSEAH